MRRVENMLAILFAAAAAIYLVVVAVVSMVTYP